MASSERMNAGTWPLTRMPYWCARSAVACTHPVWEERRQEPAAAALDARGGIPRAGAGREQRRDVAPVYVHVLRRQQAGVLRIEHAHVADHDRIGQAVREAAGELVQPVVLGLYLQPLELGSLPLPALLDDARQTRYHQGEEPVILWPREPDEVRSRVDTDYRVERDRQALAARLQLAVEDLPHRQLAS